MLGSDASTPDIIAASAKAAERDLLGATSDPAYVEAVRLLLGIPFAARSDDFGQALRDLDLQISDRPELMDLVAAVTQRLDDVRIGSSASADLGEIAARALTATLSGTIGRELPGLFGATPEDVQAAARKLSWSKGVAELSRSFFARLTSDTLSYWLDRTLSSHIGPERRFTDVGDKTRFDQELGVYTSEATRIIQEFSGGWYGKTLHRDGQIGSHQAAVFGAVALKKIVSEMRERNRADA